MTRRSSILFASMVALAAAASCPAMASVYYVSYTGSASGVDTNGLFGAAGATLSGVAFTTNYSYDTSQFGSAYLASGAGYTYVYGGSSNGVTDPLLSASISINGSTFNQSSFYIGEEQLATAPGYASVVDEACSSASNCLQDYLYPISFVTTSLTALQSFAIPALAQDVSYLHYNGESIQLKEAYFTVTNVAPPSAPTPVPEPASLALLAGAAGVFAAAIGVCRAMSSRCLGVASRQMVA